MGVREYVSNTVKELPVWVRVYVSYTIAGVRVYFSSAVRYDRRMISRESTVVITIKWTLEEFNGVGPFEIAEFREFLELTLHAKLWF